MRFREDIKLRNIAGEHVIVDPGQQMVDMSKVFTLNETAADIWNEFQSKTFTKEDVINYLVETYTIDIKDAIVDTDELLKVLAEQGLLIK